MPQNISVHTSNRGHAPQGQSHCPMLAAQMGQIRVGLCHTQQNGNMLAMFGAHTHDQNTAVYSSTCTMNKKHNEQMLGQIPFKMEKF